MKEKGVPGKNPAQETRVFLLLLFHFIHNNRQVKNVYTQGEHCDVCTHYTPMIGS